MSGRYSLWMQLGAAMTIKNTRVKEGNVVEIKRKIYILAIGPDNIPGPV